MRLAGPAVISALPLGVACGGTGGGATPATPDAGSPDAADVGLVLPDPALPQLPDWDCPEGWEAEEVGAGTSWSHRVCRPAARAGCGPSELQGPGETGCRPVGTACPEPPERFPPEEVIRALVPGMSGPLRHVDKQAPAGGTGTREAPLPSLETAHLLPAAAGTVFVLGPGTWAEHFIADADVALVGACPAATVVTPAEAGSHVLLGRGEARVALANLTVRGEGHALVALHSARARLSGVVIEGSAGAGVVLAGPGVEATIEDVVVSGVRSDGVLEGIGVLVQTAASVEARRLRIEDCSGPGLRVHREPPDGSTTVVRLEDVVLRATEPGLWAWGDTVTTLSRVLVEEHRSAGVMVGRELRPGDPYPGDPRVVLEDARIREGRPASSNGAAVGVSASSGGRLTLRQVVVERCIGLGAYASAYHADRPAVIEADGLLLQHSLSYSAHELWGSGGRGLSAWGAVELTLSRTVLSDNLETAAGLALEEGDTPPSLDLTDVVITGTESLVGLRGHGLDAGSGTQVSGRRILLAGNREVGLLAEGWGGAPETRVTLSDLTVEDTRPAACGAVPEGDPWACPYGGPKTGGGLGILVNAGARVRLEGFSVAGSADTGMCVADESVISGTRGVVTDNEVGLAFVRAPPDAIRLSDDVYVFGNRTDVSREEVPLPSAASALVLPSGNGQPPP